MPVTWRPGSCCQRATSVPSEIPSWIVYACIPLGSYLMCFRFLQVMWAYYWTGELPHHDQSHVEGIETSEKAPIALGEA